MVPQAPFEVTEHGPLPAGAGWFVLNAREARWFHFAGRGRAPALQGRGDFPHVGLGLTVLEPGEPMSMYHWESDQEDFLVLSGEALLIAEGQERPLRQWDFVHCPPETRHVIVGAGEGPCVIFAVGALENHTTGSRVDGTLQGRDDGGAYTVDEAALRHGAGVEEETIDADVAYARFPEPEPTPYREGWLPSMEISRVSAGPVDAEQLAALAEVASLLDRSGFDYWLFGGWAVDFHVGAVTRPHDDVDVAVWLDEAPAIGSLLRAGGWRHAPAADEDGGTGYERGRARLELTFLTRDAAGQVFVPLRAGQVLWSAEPFGNEVRELLGVRARVLPLAVLRSGKSSARDEPDEAAKDEADFQALSALSP